MKKWLLFFLLLNYINTTMFIPVIEETMVVKKMHRHYDETNSLAELIKKEVFGKHSPKATDEDDDQPLAPAMAGIKLTTMAVSDIVSPAILGTPITVVHLSPDNTPSIQDGYLRKDSPPPDFS